MNITNTPAVPASASAAQGSTAETAQIMVMKKAMNLQSANAAALIQSVPQPPALATSGALGTQVNAYA